MSAPVLSWPFIANGRGLRPRVRRAQHSRHPEAATAPHAPRPNFPPPGPQSQSFSRSYGSILPTSLIYIILSTRGCSPWRPDAVMSTPWGDNETRPSIFKGHPEGTGHTRGSCALPAVYPSLRVNRFQGNRLLTSKENACRTSVWRLLAPLVALPQHPHPGAGILTGFPFDRLGDRDRPIQNGVSLSLRSGSLTSNCCSRQTFLHFSLQSSHLNICYYHQDLH